MSNGSKKLTTEMTDDPVVQEHSTLGLIGIGGSLYDFHPLGSTTDFSFTRTRITVYYRHLLVSELMS